MRLLRGIRNMVQSGCFQMMNELTIHLVSPNLIQLMDIWPGDFRVILRARILKKAPHNLETYPIQKGHYIDDTDWSNVEAVDSAVESHKSRLCSELSAHREYYAVHDLLCMPCGQMCEVLRALLGKPSHSESSKRFLFLYVYQDDDLSCPKAKGFAATSA